MSLSQRMREKFTDLSSRMNIYPDKLPLVSNLIVFFVLLIWFFFSYYQWIGDSEFWPISLAGHWGQSSQNPSLLYKAVFHGTLSWIHLWDLSNVLHIKIAKALYAGLGVALIFVLYQILKSKLGSLKALILVLLLLSNSMAFANLGLIRSDNLSTLLLLILFWTLLRFDSAEWKSLFGIFVVGSIPVFLSTPKSVYGIFILWIYVFFYVKPSLRLRFLNTSMALSIVILLPLLGLDKIGFLENFHKSMISALAYHMEAQSYYPGFLSRFNKPYFLKDIIFYVGVVTLLVWQIFSSFRKKSIRYPATAAYTAMGVATWIAFLVQRPSLPFFLASLLPFVLLSLIPILSKCKNLWLTGLLFVALLTSGVWGRHELFFVSNGPQFETINKIEKHLASCKARSQIFDGLAIFPSLKKTNSILAYVAGDDDIAVKGGLQAFQSIKPEMVILSGKIITISHQFSEFVIENYESVGKGYWIRKDLKAQCHLNFEDLPMSWKIFGYTTDERL